MTIRPLLAKPNQHTRYKGEITTTIQEPITYAPSESRHKRKVLYSVTTDSYTECNDCLRHWLLNNDWLSKSAYANSDLYATITYYEVLELPDSITCGKI